MPILLVAPVVWVGMELVRGYMVTGFSGCLLGHTLAYQPVAIQFADQLGAYGISAMVVIMGIVIHELASMLHGTRQKPSVANLTIGCLLSGMVLFYGFFRIENPNRESPPLLRAALIQENFPSVFELQPDRKKAGEAWAAYLDQTKRARSEYGTVDLVVWPESVFTGGAPYVTLEAKQTVPEEWRADVDFSGMMELMQELEKGRNQKSSLIVAAANDQKFQIGSTPSTENHYTTHFLVGNDYWRIMDDHINSYNAAILLDPSGEMIDHYEKQHLVMFGEFIPLGNLVGLPSLSAGERYVPFRLGKVTLAPSICFESVLPHLVRSQLEIADELGNKDVVLINITNDSWFRGSSILDIHLSCEIFAAVENRRPMLIAGNTGISAWIDASGRVVKSLPRNEKGSILAEPIFRYSPWIVDLCG